MNKATLLTLPCLCATLLAPVICNGEDFLLYTPKPTETGQAPASPDQGVLVRSLTIKRGDTLKKISREYLGRASWFPQVLVFNKIKNPNLIHTGDKVLVPVPAEQTASEKKAEPARKHAKGKKRHGGRRAKGQGREVSKTATVEPGASRPEFQKPEAAKPQVSAPQVAKPQVTKPQASQQPVASGEQESYLQAKLAYMKGDYQKSLALFNEFLSKFPRSSSAPDASLYRADCLLHLAGE